MITSTALRSDQTGTSVLFAPPSKAKRQYAHSNDAVVRSYEPVLDLPERLVLLDLDGSAYDPWGCTSHVGHRGNFASDRNPDGSIACTHVRADVLENVREACRLHDAKLAILSWRAGLVETSIKWLAEVGLDPVAVFIPGSRDDVTGPYLHLFRRGVWGGGQVQFKACTVTALMAKGVEVVAAFDDNTEVVTTLRDKLGVRGASLVPRLVNIAPHELDAGYIGAPKPTYTQRWDGGRSNSRQHDDFYNPSDEPTLFDDRNSTDWDDATAKLAERDRGNRRLDEDWDLDDLDGSGFDSDGEIGLYSGDVIRWHDRTGRMVQAWYLGMEDGYVVAQEESSGRILYVRPDEEIDVATNGTATCWEPIGV